jgi:hypothetical protein
MICTKHDTITVNFPILQNLGAYTLLHEFHDKFQGITGPSLHTCWGCEVFAATLRIHRSSLTTAWKTGWEWHGTRQIEPTIWDAVLSKNVWAFATNFRAAHELIGPSYGNSGSLYGGPVLAGSNCWWSACEQGESWRRILKNRMGAALEFHRIPKYPNNSCKMPQVSSLKSHGSHGSAKKDNCPNRFRSSLKDAPGKFKQGWDWSENVWFPSTSPAVGVLRKYRMNTTGPQCPGLLGDFVYLSPGLELTVKKLQDPWTGTSPPKCWRWNRTPWGLENDLVVG